MLLITITVLALLIFKPELLQNIFNQGITSALGYGTSLNYNQPLSALKYLRNFSLMVSVFAIIGTIVAVKLRRKTEVYIFYMDNCNVSFEYILLVWN